MYIDSKIQFSYECILLSTSQEKCCQQENQLKVLWEKQTPSRHMYMLNRDKEIFSKTPVGYYIIKCGNTKLGPDGKN